MDPVKVQLGDPEFYWSCCRNLGEELLRGTEVFQRQLRHQGKIDDSHKIWKPGAHRAACCEFESVRVAPSLFQASLLDSASSSGVALSETDPVWLCIGFSGWLFRWLCHT